MRKYEEQIQGFNVYLIVILEGENKISVGNEVIREKAGDYFLS